MNGLDDRPVGATADLETLRSGIESKLRDEGELAEKVIDDLIEDTKGGLHGSAGGRFFAWVIGGSLPSALADLSYWLLRILSLFYASD